MSTACLNPILSVVFKPLVRYNFYACLDKIFFGQNQCGNVALIDDLFYSIYEKKFKKKISKARSRCRFCKDLSSLGSKVSVFFMPKKAKI